MADRPLTVGIALSMAVHALVVAAVVLVARTEGPATARPEQSAQDRGVEVAFLSAPENASGPRAADPAPVVATTPSPKIGSTQPERIATLPDLTASAGAPAAQPPQAGDGAASTTAAQPAAFDPAAGDNYRRRLFEHIAAYRRPPAPTDGEPSTGTVMVRFSILRGGNVIAVSVATTSGAPNLDDDAVATVWRAGPMPAIPPALPERLSVTLPVSFGPGVRAPG